MVDSTEEQLVDSMAAFMAGVSVAVASTAEAGTVNAGNGRGERLRDGETQKFI